MFLNRFDYKYNFMGIRHIAMAISAVLILICIISFGVRGLVFGLDFTGGTLIEVGYNQPIQLEKIRANLHNNGFTDAVLQYFGTNRDVIIRLGQHQESPDNPLSTQILQILQTSGEEFEIRRVEYVGPQVGKELVEKGTLAVIYTLIGILIYVAWRFEYRFAIGAIVALLHDPILIVGIFSLFQLEFDLTVLAAILAVIGYSINDTIVVFDRIRDNFIKMRKQSVVAVMNISVNQILGRTVMTSTTTLLVLLVLFGIGGDLIHGFAIALIAGVVVGTYSSIYIASALALELGVSRENLMPIPKEGANIKDS